MDEVISLNIVETKYLKYNVQTTSRADLHRLFKVTNDIEHPSGSFV